MKYMEKSLQSFSLLPIIFIKISEKNSAVWDPQRSQGAHRRKSTAAGAGAGSEAQELQNEECLLRKKETSLATS